MNFRKYIETQKFSENINLSEIKLINTITNFLINHTPDNFKKVLKQFAILSKTFHLILEVPKDKKQVNQKELLNEVANLILNNSGYLENLQKSLNLIIWFAKDKKLKIEFK